jgi:Xaa-Pro aminopeptidase
LQELEIKFRNMVNPIALLKAVKNEKELTHMREAFHKADQVVHQTQSFVVDSFEKGQPISEGQVDDYVKERFFASGANDLSFRPICASGKNGAVIHYGTPDRETHVERGALFLLDTGAYYQGGYATDLTRTFLAAPKNSPAQSWQKEMFTLVLIASIRGLSARIRSGTTGMQLDAIVREPLWQRGLDFAHGTGHGVGINVHEFPPRIGPTSTSPLLPSQVFSIEPGLYFEGLGGVRIENLATIVADPDDERFVRVLPLTFCPFDERLIEEKLLSESDHEFLRYYRAQWQKGGGWPQLPPLSGVKWAR